ncbi:MAG TPA: hypothetical protein VLA69_09305, partial [Gaiellaceae bacterium]|nr:hypothetical protein [Gaiellaceae bacterium]
MNQALVSTSTPAAKRSVVAVVDRLFPLVWIGMYLLIPVSGWATVMFDSWFDQQRDLEALRSVLAEGRADAIADNVIGPAYIAVAALLHDVLGLSPEDALVVLTRASYALSVACGVLLVGVLVRRLVGAPPIASLGAQFLFVALIFATGTWHWSDVPWSHFFAAFLAVALYAVRFAPVRLTPVHAAIAGVVVALLYLTRSFELAALIAAWAGVFVLLAALRLTGPRAWRTAHLVSAVVAFVATTVVVYAVTGKRDLFLLYGNYLDRQSGNVGSAEIAETPTFSLSLVPTKLVQLFVEPCYYSLCSVSDYAGGTRPLPPQLAEAAGNERLWRLPLAIQLPSLVLLPLCVLAVVGIVVWATRRRSAASKRVREIRLLLEMTVASVGIVLGYSASTMTGSPHLRYGFARDFLLPALLTGVVAISLVSAALWLLLSRRRAGRFSPEFGFVVLAVVGGAAIVVVLVMARASGLPRIESRQLGPIEYTASCRGAVCDISLTAETTSGRSIS